MRWPAPILTATVAITLVGLLALPGFKPSYNDQQYLPERYSGQSGDGGRSATFSTVGNDDARDIDGREPIAICAIRQTFWF